jgi:hypothetical protein
MTQHGTFRTGWTWTCECGTCSQLYDELAASRKGHAAHVRHHRRRAAKAQA